MTANIAACAAPGCDTLISSTRLMCNEHWNRIPSEVRTALTGAWYLYRRALVADADDLPDRLKDYETIRAEALEVMR